MPIDQKDITNNLIKTLFNGFAKNPGAMISALCVIACAGMWYSSEKKAAEQLEREERRSDKQVEQVINVLRPDLKEIKENVEQAKQNIDTVNHKIK